MLDGGIVMEWIEANLLPEECRVCQEEDCYNCDYAGKRWYMSQKDNLWIRRKYLMNAIERLQREVDSIDLQLISYNRKACLITNEERSKTSTK